MGNNMVILPSENNSQLLDPIKSGGSFSKNIQNFESHHIPSRPILEMDQEEDKKISKRSKGKLKRMEKMKRKKEEMEL